MKIKTQSALQRRLVGATFILMLSACGGGGSDTGPDLSPKFAASESVARLALDTTFTADYLPISPVGANWVYTATQDSNNQSLGNYTVRVASVDNAGVATFTGQSSMGIGTPLLSMPSRYTKDQNGLYGVINPSNISIAGAEKFLQPIRLYAVPSFAVGETRTVVRQATGDLDKDGQPDLVDIRYAQVYKGIEAIQLGASLVNAAHFSNTLNIFVNATKSGVQDGGLVMEEAWLVPGLGPVKYQRRVLNLKNSEVIPSATYTLTSAQVGSYQFP